MSIVVLLFFFGLLAYMFLTDTQGRFLTLVMGTVLFPTTALFIKTRPSLRSIFSYMLSSSLNFSRTGKPSIKVFLATCYSFLSASVPSVTYLRPSTIPASPPRTCITAYAMSLTDSVTFTPPSFAAAKKTFTRLPKS